MTVGFGITPNLLSKPAASAEGVALAGFVGPTTYRRWGIAPRPENAVKLHRSREICNTKRVAHLRINAMHPNPIYHDADALRNLDFARERGFGILATNGEDGPMLAHVPFLLDAAGETAGLHLVRSNPIARALKEPLVVKIAVSGPDTYISPDWYGVPDQVPTWNYVAVHLTGVLEMRPQDELHDLLGRQSAFYEDRLLPKPPWKTAKMTPEIMEKMMRQIVPCRMRITGVDGTWKLNQNKPDEVRLSAADQVAAYGFGAETDIIAALMRGARKG
jgi:transcriptional regulator